MHPEKVVRDGVKQLTDLPNIGPAMARDLIALGIQQPAQLRGCSPLNLYQRLCDITGKQQDPCVLDVIMSIIAFVEGGEPQPWWHFTAVRKALLTRQAAGTLACPCLLPGQ
ncbi:MAG: helix-hairpin-helix domain-containing protein [Aeromonadaceae bacterium]